MHLVFRSCLIVSLAWLAEMAIAAAPAAPNTNSVVAAAETNKPPAATPPARPRGSYMSRAELGPNGDLGAPAPIWMSECREPAGQGLALDGLAQYEERGRPHTRILVDGAWTNIYPELCAKNPLQTHCDRANALQIELMRARARTRHIWFKGLEPADERQRLDAEALPPFRAFLASFDKLTGALQTIQGLPEYEQGQVAVALRHFAAAREVLKTTEGMAKEVLAAAHINAMQKAQIKIEDGANALDAEPPPRVLSRAAYDAKTGLYVLFGGDHFDFLMNDTWVFDPAQKKWLQRHPVGAPSPRGKAEIKASGDGTIRLHGGYGYPDPRRNAEGYLYQGDDVWTYDIAANVWSGPATEKPAPPDTRIYRGGDRYPDHFLQGNKPNAAQHAKVLAALPVNTWVDMNPPYKRSGWRAWGTMAYDTENDLIVDWNGGHSCYCGTDAPHYHLGVNRWELPYPAENPLGMTGASAAAVRGFSFNRRHWITNHTWNHYLYDPRLKRVLVAGSQSHRGDQRDAHSYIYDPVLGEWESRFRKNPELGAAHPMDVNVVHTSLGTMAYAGITSAWWLLNYEKMQWELFTKTGKTWPVRTAASDWYTHVYDPKGHRILGMGLPSKGESLFVLDLATKTVSTIKPENPGVLGEGFGAGREWRYLPDDRIFLVGTGLKSAGENMPAYDAENNRWLVLRLKGKPALGVDGSMHYDEKRKLLWALDSRGNVKALRLDLKKALMNEPAAADSANPKLP